MVSTAQVERRRPGSRRRHVAWLERGIADRISWIVWRERSLVGVASFRPVLTIGEPEVLVRILFVVTPLLTAMSAHRLFRRVVGLGTTTVLLASFWGMLPVLTGGLARAR